MAVPEKIKPGDIVVTPLPHHAGYSVGRVRGPIAAGQVEFIPLGAAATEGAAVERAQGVAAGRRVWLIGDDGSYIDRTPAS